MDSFEEQNKIYILFYEKKKILDGLFDSLNEDEINLEGWVEGHSEPIKKKKYIIYYQKKYPYVTSIMKK